MQNLDNNKKNVQNENQQGTAEYLSAVPLRVFAKETRAVPCLSMNTHTNTFQDTERKRFRDLTPGERTLVLFDSVRAIRGDIANLKRAVLDFQEDLTVYRHHREEKEQSTEEKIETILNKRFDFWTWFRDKVLPSIVTFIVMALLYLVFAK